MVDNDDKKPAHTLADHLYGRDVVHVHADDADHDHDHDFDADDGPLEDNPLWRQDNVALMTVGIDIGSSGTQVIFSRVHLRRLAEDLTSRYYVVARETLFQSPVALTPYRSEVLIDDQKLGVIIDDAYVAAGLSPDQIDTGVVILTGEALRRENAERIAAILSEQGGEFVTATAGHHMEAMLAAYGSGAARVSSDEAKRILNIDIGGGTTKLALVDNGKVIATAAVHIGGRLQVVEDGRIVRLDPAGKHHAKRAGFSWNRGDVVAEADLAKVADGMADALIAAVTARPLPHPSRSFISPIRLAISAASTASCFPAASPNMSISAKRAISATSARSSAAPSAPGWRTARCHLLFLGRCCRPANASAPPRSAPRNTACNCPAIPAISRRRGRCCRAAIFRSCNRPSSPPRSSIRNSWRKAIRGHIAAFDLAGTERDIALALRWTGLPTYQRLAAFAEGIRRGLADRIAKKLPLYIMLDGDVAQTLGHLLRDELHVESELLVIDGVVLWDFDYIDLGRIRMPSYTVPVTIKSLVFSEDPRGPRPRQRLHHHEHEHLIITAMTMITTITTIMSSRRFKRF